MDISDPLFTGGIPTIKVGKSQPVSLKRKRGGVKSKRNRLSKIKKSIKSLREKSLNFAILGVVTSNRWETYKSN